jgi:hypothetical protein
MGGKSMSRILTIALTASLLSASAMAAPSVNSSDNVVKPDTPSGEGDPNITVCRAPQRLAGTDQFGPQVCLHNQEWSKVAMNGKDIAPDGRTLVDRPTVDAPRGDGNPDTVTCRTPRFVGGRRIEVCRPNRFWADAIKRHVTVNDIGQAVLGGVPPV